MRKVLILTAIPKEMEAVMECLPRGLTDWTERQIEEGYSFFEASIETPEETYRCFVTSQVRQGPTYATSHTLLMFQLNPDFVFMSGICAGNRNKDIKLGDVILSDIAFDYDTGKQTNEGFKPEKACSNVDDLVVQRLKDFCRSNSNFIEIDGVQRRLHVGPFASGSKVIAIDNFFSNLEVQERNVLALDMEAYHVLKAIEVKNRPVPAVIIKGVVDYADGKKNDDYHQIAATAAAITTFSVISYILKRTPPKQQIQTSELTYPIVLQRPAITQWHRMQWRSLFGWPDDYYSNFARNDETGQIDENHEGSGIEFYDLKDGKWLVEVVVSFGAYQGDFRYYYLDESKSPHKWSEVLFRNIRWNHANEIRETLSPEIFGIPSFDPESKLITTFEKGRGIGDCGALITYRFLDDATTELIEYRYRELPDSSMDYDIENTPPPEEWPLFDISIRYPTWSDSDEY